MRLTILLIAAHTGLAGRPTQGEPGDCDVGRSAAVP